MTESVLSDGKNMLTQTILSIGSYLTGEQNYEQYDLRSIVYDLNLELKRKLYKHWTKLEANTKELFLTHLEDCKKAIDKIKELRIIYQKGASFANNNTKGKGKLHTPVNMALSSIQASKTFFGEEKAFEEAQKELNSVKQLYSERTYYRLLKQVKMLYPNFQFKREKIPI